METMADTKVVPCPSGGDCPDTFRLYEALEAGCVPVVDSHASRNLVPGFWDFLFPGGFPFPVVDTWAEFPDVLGELLEDWVSWSNLVFSWWVNYKYDLKRCLELDVSLLCR